VGRLALVKEDGKAHFLRQGVNTLSHLDGGRTHAPCAPGEVVDLQVEMPSAAWATK